jgi:hypothetical protein
MEERSLDEFVETADTDGDAEEGPTTSGATGTDESAGGKEEAANEEDDDRVLPESVDPAAVTSRVVPGGAVCEGCGEQVSRLWTGEDGERCRDCKEW